ncbi:hypothetical protein Mapa_006111 [Marchantia paleacea]|nr:hypothetical protein Mapa_006111 [Marchantia paleacea]
MPAPGDRYDEDDRSSTDDEGNEEAANLRNGEASTRGQYTYNSLFKLDLPQCQDDVHISSGNSSEDGSDSGRDNWRLNGHANGGDAERPSDIQSEMTMKRKRVQVEADAGCNSARRDDSDSNDEDEDDSIYAISEEVYREMLSEHYQRYKRARLQEAVAARSSVAAVRRTESAKQKALGNYQTDPNGFDGSNHQTSDFVKQYSRKNRMKKTDQYGNTMKDLYSGTTSGISPGGSEMHTGLTIERMTAEGGPLFNLLDIGGGVQFQIPPAYERLASSLHLPDLAELQISERILSGKISSTSLLPRMASDPRAKLWRLRAGMGESWDSLRHPGGMLRMFQEEGQRRFSLQVLDRASMHLSSSYIAEGSTGPSLGLEALDGSQQGDPITLRHISSDGGLMSHCEVKIIERGDGYEVIQRRIERKESKKDPALVAREDFDKIGRHWANLVRKDLPKHHKFFMTYHKRQLVDVKRFAEFCQREVRTRNMRSLKLLRAAPMRIRRLARDMVIFWKRVDKEQAEVRRKEEKDAADALKRQEELREAKRQQQRLNFLLTQTELYSHFMQNKLAGGTPAVTDTAAVLSASDDTSAANDTKLSEEDAAEEAALKEEAVRAATQAAAQAKNRTNAFDSESSKLRQAAGLEDDEQDGMQVDGSSDIDLLNPSTMPTTSSVQQPKLFQGILKEYQLKGLQWLVNCYEQGLNGILADEMGLGKTIQAMAFLGHLAEEKNIWGPFLVVAPASVLNNWADEVNRFCPDLKILPYWGGLNERTVLRKNINPKRLYKRDAGFHVLITSYQLLVSDEKYFRRVKWQYMVLDEAQAIKSASSLRWKTLLSFNCRNRLLLTGTPIQNSMAELWALLHFIMPTLFDSHEQFSEWFSKGIEGHAEHGGTLNEHQLTRLHAILKPFMLRRVKKDVITEMTNKKEVVVSCSLSSRQQAFYKAIKNKISVADLFDSKGAMNDKKVLNLMNIVIQLRKVCNHPELFERNEGNSFLHFAAMKNSLLPPTFGELEEIHYAGACNPISYQIPKLLYRDGLRCLPTSSSGSCQGFAEKWLKNRLSIFSADNIHYSIFSHSEGGGCQGSYSRSGGFGFCRLLNLSPSEVEFLAKASTQERWLYSILLDDSPLIGQILAQQEKSDIGDESLEADIEDPKTRAVRRLLMIPGRSESSLLREKRFTGRTSDPFEALIISYKERFLQSVGLLRSVRKLMPAVRAPQIDIVCSDRGFSFQRTEELQDPWMKRLLVGFGRTSDFNGPSLPRAPHHLVAEQAVKIKVQEPLLSLPYRIFGSAPPVRSFDFAKMLTDSGKLHILDGLLKRLRAGDHRVLLFAQMTKMLNILEDYMNYRKYKYLRLDGSSTIMDRRDMVKDFQHRGDIFVFLLSTRAGGLGINLTAADTVIFYESDWNPTMDLQAMDRAHRLGQTKEVTVYRLICKGTVEEKIMKRASQKNTVQQLVMTGGQSQGDVFQAEEVVSLLLDDAELEQRLKEQQQGSKATDKAEKRRKGWGGGSATKGVRLDAEGGDASLDEEALVALGDGLKTSQDGANVAPDGDRAVVGVTEGIAEKAGRGGGRKRRRGEGRAPRPPKAPKPPKEPKPAKEPRVRKDRRQPKVPRPPRTPGLPRARAGRPGRPKKSEKSPATSGSVPPESLGLLSSVTGRADGHQQTVDSAANGESSTPVKLSAHSGDASNGEQVNTLGVSSDATADNGNRELELPQGADFVKSGLGKGKNRGGGKEKSAALEVVGIGKARSRPPKRRKNSLDLDSRTVGLNHTAMNSGTSHPLVGTLKLSLHSQQQKQPLVERSLSSLSAEDPL